MIASLPMPNGPSSIRSMCSTVGVQLGQLGTSTVTCHTISVGASIWISCSSFMGGYYWVVDLLEAVSIGTGGERVPWGREIQSILVLRESSVRRHQLVLQAELTRGAWVFRIAVETCWTSTLYILLFSHQSLHSMPYRLPHPEAAPPKLDASNVPRDVHDLIPLAERYGIADDGYRSEMVSMLDELERQELKSAVQKHEDALEAWLAGPAADAEEFSDEYVAFSALVMAADEV